MDILLWLSSYFQSNKGSSSFDLMKCQCVMMSLCMANKSPQESQNQRMCSFLCLHISQHMAKLVESSAWIESLQKILHAKNVHAVCEKSGSVSQPEKRFVRRENSAIENVSLTIFLIEFFIISWISQRNGIYFSNILSNLCKALWKLRCFHSFNLYYWVYCEVRFF